MTTKLSTSFKILILTLAMLFTTINNINASEEEYDISQFRGWLVDFTKEAESKGISDKTIYDFLRNAEFLPRVIQLDRKQPYKTKTFKQYVDNIIPQYKIQEAKKRLQANKELLSEVGAKYKVQPRFIVALWAMESDFGRNMGSFSIVNSLATLAYEGRRAEFFRKELFDALTIIDEGHIDFADMKGSWAGAMGQTQFMPSSFLELAIDYNKDGKRDIWQTREDVFGSIANYLSKRGWNNEITWGREVKLPKNFSEKLIDKNIEKSLQQWHNLGVRRADGSPLPKKAGLQASLIRPEDAKKATYLVYSNYKTVLKWNRSLYFATAVGILSDGMVN